MNNYDTNDETVKIPDFMNEKDTGDTSADMSIFNLSDEDLYEDEPKNDDKKPKKKANSTIILCLIVIAILIVTSVVGIVYAINQHSALAAAEEKNTELVAQNTELKNANETLQAQVTTLQEQIKASETAGATADPNVKYAAGTKLYITEEGSSQCAREKADVDSTKATKNGSEYTLWWGDSVTLTENAIVDASGNYWGKIDVGYIRIEYNGEIWATTEEQ